MAPGSLSRLFASLPAKEKGCGGDFCSCLRVLNLAVHWVALKMRLLVSRELRVPCMGSCVSAAVNVALISEMRLTLVAYLMALHGEKYQVLSCVTYHQGNKKGTVPIWSR